jgi:hypothetical protein
MPRPIHPKATPKKPVGQITRGKTAANRLRRVDNFVLLYDPSLLTRSDGEFADSLFVDLGYGAEATTTLESAARFRRLNPGLPILGVEIDDERVRNALPFADERTFFRKGGFNLPLLQGEKVRLIRAFNVLRQYEESEFAPAYEQLAPYVLPGGLMIEGTSDPFGRVWVANLARRVAGRVENGYLTESSDGWQREGLVFSTNFRWGFDPAQFQPVLPKNLIHHVVPGEEIFDFFEAWKRSAAETAHAKVWGLRHWFIAAGEALGAKGYRVNTQRKWLEKGWLIWGL